ncbi:hypothetical protein CRG98_002478 [Punica granatum]|uniref:Reverse transcriptase domain-containing protein n=1 Tax=Punica granatum TaxID=22663 RepID=A0A2I0L8F4_PUNGR|nr:hypothetical protein CRG98_002478 [Punica granatum]
MKSARRAHCRGRLKRKSEKRGLKSQTTGNLRESRNRRNSGAAISYELRKRISWREERTVEGAMVASEEVVVRAVEVRELLKLTDELLQHGQLHFHAPTLRAPYTPLTRTKQPLLLQPIADELLTVNRREPLRWLNRPPHDEFFQNKFPLWEKGTNSTEKWGTHLNWSPVAQGDGRRGYLGRVATAIDGICRASLHRAGRRRGKSGPFCKMLPVVLKYPEMPPVFCQSFSILPPEKKKWGTDLNWSPVAQGDGRYVYLGRWACRASWCISESGRGEGSSRSRPISGDGVARAGFWSLHRNLFARGESLQLLGEIRPSRGIRQGDPPSPYLFILCMEYFSNMIEDAVRDKKWSDIQPSRDCFGCSHLLFVENIILLGKADIETQTSVLNVLTSLCKASGMKASRRGLLSF